MPSNSVNSPTQNASSSVKVQARTLIGNSLGFRDCQVTSLDALVSAGSVRTLGKGQVLVHRGDPFDTLCLVVRGSLETRIMHADGHRHLISFLQPGDIAGLISVLDRLGHMNDLVAREAGTAVLLMPGPLVRELREVDHLIGRAFEMQLAFRSRLLHDRLAADPAMALDARLARLLLLLARLHGQQRPDGLLLTIKIAQTDLADWLGASRQSVNAALQTLRQKDLIRMTYSTVTLVDFARLTALACF